MASAAHPRKDIAPGDTHGPRRPHRHLVSVGVVTAAEALMLAALSFMLVLNVIPDAFDVKWGCIGHGGFTRTAGDDYANAFAVVGAVGWLAVLGGTALASVTDRRWLAFVIPLAWFSVLTLASLVVTVLMGPQPC